jgi:hypothetical protein
VSTGVWLHRGDDPAYTHYTYAQTIEDTDDARLRVAWHEQYNGTFQEHQNGTAPTSATTALDPGSSPLYVPEADGPVIGLPNVLPGDGGRLAIGLFAEDLTEDDQGVDVWMRLVVTENRENGVTEPESEAPAEDDPAGPTSGDDDPGQPLGTGELADAMSATVWIDSGMAGIGRCDGALGVGETPLAEGTLTAVADELESGRRIASCLPQGQKRCVGLTWELAGAVGDAIQSDSVAFGVEFLGQPCDEPNPWGQP